MTEYTTKKEALARRAAPGSDTASDSGGSVVTLFPSAAKTSSCYCGAVTLDSSRSEHLLVTRGGVSNEQ
jgi:hypothetical protein